MKKNKREIKEYLIFFGELTMVVLVWRAIWGLADWLFLERISPLDYIVSICIFISYTIFRKKKIGF
jgi:hypothetical protein